MLQVAAQTFELHVKPGTEGRTLLGNITGKVYMPLKSSVVLLEQDGRRVVLLTSHLLTHYYNVSNIYRRHVAAALGISRDDVLVFSSHNHCTVKLMHNQYSIGRDDYNLHLPESELTPVGDELLRQYVAIAKDLVGKLAPVTVRFGQGHERRISHNRKGRRADGSTYLMREEDRLLLGDDFCGDIDDDAFVVGFFDRQDKPVCFLTHFTAHPVTAFHCDHPVVHGEFPQVACDDLSAAYGGVPAVFLQGCAGDTNSKGLLSSKPADENAKDAERYGHCLGETFIQIARSLRPSASTDLSLAWRWAALPFAQVPPAAELQARLAETEAFMARCDRGDVEKTRSCDGLNFPSNMTLPYRKALIAPVNRWLQWCLAFHTEHRLHEAPTQLRLHFAALRIGDVGIVGMPCEPLLGIGRLMKRISPMPITLPCGYMNDTSVGYVPDSANCGDREYMSQFCRYTTSQLPYRHPAGDLLAHAGASLLKQLLEPTP